MGDPSSGPVDQDSVLELTSMTKLVAVIAALQFIEKGTLSLDDPDQMYRHLPELRDIQILEGYDDDDRPILVPQKSRITLRMLMDHTSGAPLQKWYQAQEDPAPSIFSPGASLESITSPLEFQPGTSLAYSSGLDWVGVIITRLSGLDLEEYCQQNIFARVEGGMPNTSFYPRPDMVRRKVMIYDRSPSGELIPWPNGFLWDRPTRPEDVSKEVFFATGGLYGSTRDYLAFLRSILQCDPRNQTKPTQPLISGDTYKLLWEPSVTSEAGKKVMAEMLKAGNSLFFEPTPDNVNYSVAFGLFNGHSEHGRKAGSGGWFGLAHTHHWIDPVVGLAGVCNTQIIGSDPMPWKKMFNDYERVLYNVLQESST